MKAKRYKRLATEDESLEFIVGTGGYAFTELTKPEKVSPRIEGFVKKKKAPVKRTRTTRKAK